MATEDVKVKIKIDGDTKKVDKNLKKTQKQLKKTEKSAKKAFSPSIFLGATAAVAAIGLALKGLISEASKIEDIGVQFEVLTGSTKVAQKAMEELMAFSASTPFQFEDIAEAGKKLLGFGFSVDSLKPKLRELGDVSAALGVPLQDLSLIYGQVSAAQKLTGERLLQFQERAIPIGAALAKVMKQPESAIKDLVSEGKVSFAIFEKAFASLSEEGGVAFGGLEKKSKTLSGRISTLRDNFSQLAVAIGQKMIPASGGFAEILLVATQYWTKVIKGTSKGTESLTSLNKQLENNAKSLKEQREASEGVITRLFGLEKKFLVNIIDLEQERFAIQQKIAAKKKTGDDTPDKEAEKLRILAEAKAAYLEEQANQEKEFANLSLDQANKRIEEIKDAEDEAKIIALEDEQKYTEALALEQDLRLQKIVDRLTAEKAAKDKDKEDDEKRNKKALDAQVKFDKVSLKVKADNDKKELSLAKATGQAFIALAGGDKVASLLLEKSFAIADVFIKDAAARQAASLAAANAATTAALAGPGAAVTAYGATIGAMNALITKSTALSLGLIGTQTITQATAFEHGGMVDSVSARLTPGEVVIPPRTSFQDIVDAGRSISDDEGGSTHVTVGFTDNAFEIIEEKLQERQVLGVGI